MNKLLNKLLPNLAASFIKLITYLSLFINFGTYIGKYFKSTWKSLFIITFVLGAGIYIGSFMDNIAFYIYLGIVFLFTVFTATLSNSDIKKEEENDRK